METMLKKNRVIECRLGRVQIDKLLGSGGQGEVYRVTINKKPYALKWYYSSVITEALQQSIRALVEKGSPSTAFLWPIEVVESKDGFGYIMDIRPAGFDSLQDWVTRKFDMQISDLAHACMELADSFHMLHSKGLSYQDISLGNVFINKKTGRVLICDNDNVTVNGQTVGSVLGTPKFMAPELVARIKKFPDTQTDRFSLAILLFHLLMIGHPFDGAKERGIHCMDLKAAEELYNLSAVFIFHPTNNTNRPDATEHASVISLWGIYPKYLKDLFTQTFTTGVTAPDTRVRESAWRECFIQLQAHVYHCSCGREILYNSEKIGNAMKCVCSKQIIYPARMKINQYIVLLNEGRKLYKTYVDKTDNSDLSTVCAEFKYKSNGLNIKNLMGSNITHIKKDGTKCDIPSNGIAVLGNDDKLNFNGVEAMIKL